MLWFNSEKKKRMDFIRSFIPTSKAQLIQVAMWYYKGDVQKAQEMVDFYTKNLTLPDVEPVPPTLIQQMKEGAAGLYGWIKENQGDLVQGWQFIQGVIKNRGVIPAGEAAGTVAATEAALPPINGV